MNLDPEEQSIIYQVVKKEIETTNALQVAVIAYDDYTHYELTDPDLIGMITTWLHLKIGALSRTPDSPAPWKNRYKERLNQPIHTGYNFEQQAAHASSDEVHERLMEIGKTFEHEITTRAQVPATEPERKVVRNSTYYDDGSIDYFNPGGSYIGTGKSTGEPVQKCYCKGGAVVMPGCDHDIDISSCLMRKEPTKLDEDESDGRTQRSK